MKKNFLILSLTICFTIFNLGSGLNAGLFDRDDEPPGARLGYPQPCPVKRCDFKGVANGDLDIHMRQKHPKRYAAVSAIYNRSTFSAFVGIFKTLSATSSGGFKGTSGAINEFYNALRKANADGRTIANILSSDEYD